MRTRDTIRVYAVWRTDCDCGEVADYGEDESSIPENCEGCGQRIEDDAEEQPEDPLGEQG